MCFTVSVLITDLRERMTSLLVYLTQTLLLFPRGSFNSSLRSLLNIYLFTLVTNKEMHHFCSFSTKIYLHNGIIGGIIFPFCESCTAFCSTITLLLKDIVLAEYMIGLTNQRRTAKHMKLEEHNRHVAFPSLCSVCWTVWGKCLHAVDQLWLRR